jgi:hypothetical protein
MKKEKWSYLLLIAEVVVIVYLHAAKQADHSGVTPVELVKKIEPASQRPSPAFIHQAVYK